MVCTRRRRIAHGLRLRGAVKGHEVLVLDLGGVLARRPVVFLRLAAGDTGCLRRVGCGRRLRCGGRFRRCGLRRRRDRRHTALRRDDDGGRRCLRCAHGGKAGVPHGDGEHEHQLHEPPRFPQPRRARRILQREQQHGCFQCRNAPADLPAGEQDDAPDDAGTAQQHFPDAVPPDMHPDFPPQSSKCGFSFLPLRSINCLFYPFP